MVPQSNLTIRPARREEQRLIRRLVIQASLDPTSLKWRNFLLAEIDGEVVGCGQIKPYPGCRELGSLVVRRALRRQGIGGALIRALLVGEQGDVYLMCRDRMMPYYTRFAFEQIGVSQAPLVIKMKLGAGNIMGVLFGLRIAAMRLRQRGNSSPA
jgi:amino-acid N-acetyltransferase